MSPTPQQRPEKDAPGPDRPLDRPLDRPGARLVALGLFLLAVASLVWFHREDLFPPEERAVASDDPVALCLAPRATDIDGMLADGVISKQQAVLFKSRAEDLCQAQVGQGSGPPPPQ